MSINSIGAPNNTPPLASIGVATLGETKRPRSSQEAKAQAQAEAAAAQQKQALDEIRDKGIYAYSQEKKLEALKEKIRAEIEAKGIALKPGEDLESVIAREIAVRLREVTEDNLKSEAELAAKDGRSGQAMIIDISV